VVWEHLRASVEDAIAPAPPAAAARAARAGLLAACRAPAALVEAGHRALQALGWDGHTPVLVVHPGAGGAGKRWPVEAFARALAAVTRERRATVVVHEGPADADAAPPLAARLGQAALLLRQPELPLLAGVLACASAYFGNDSGVSHLAAALGRPALVLFTRAHLPWRPWSATARWLVIAPDPAPPLPPGATEPADVPAVQAALQRLLETAAGHDRAGAPATDA
jgi:ADP-heptose:LPS heptosyltransferase